MLMKDVLPRLRRERGLTQEELARRLYITRQAVSRWECGETSPGIDMIKLIARELNVPITELLDMPEHYCQSCGMMFTGPDQHGHEADGAETERYCRWCYEGGAYTYETTMDEMIEDCAPRMAEYDGLDGRRVRVAARRGASHARAVARRARRGEGNGRKGGRWG